MTDTDQQSYRKILKATSVFGGIQFLQILVQIIRSKFIAIYLGPFGVGISNLLGSTLNLINVLFNFSFATISIKDIAQANSIKDNSRISYLYSLLTKLSIILGVFGLAITIILAPLLSKIVFGNEEYTLHFIVLSLSVFFTQLVLVQNSFLQGLQKVQLLAKVSIYSSLLSLIIVIPLYKFYKLHSIVPSIIASSIVSYIVTFYFTKKIKIEKIKIEKQEFVLVSRKMLAGGMLLTLSGIISHFIPFVVSIFIGKYGNITQVGLYASGFALVNSYTGLVFSALAIDYHPRLSAISNSSTELSKAINTQGEIALLLLSPLIVVLIVFINQVIELLLSKAFLEAKFMILVALVGVFFKAASWSISFNFVARGRNRLFFWNELVSNAYNLLFAIVLFYFFGLNGLGIAFILTYFIYFFQVYLISKSDFSFKLDKSFIYTLVLHSVLSLIAIIASNNLFLNIPRYIDYLIVISVIILSLNNLNNRIGFIGLIRAKLN